MAGIPGKVLLEDGSEVTLRGGVNHVVVDASVGWTYEGGPFLEKVTAIATPIKGG